MILDKEKKLAFVHIPHNGGSNMKERLTPSDRFEVYIPEDEYYNQKINFKDPQKGHLMETPIQLIDHLPASYAPEGYLTVAFVKNPYHREVSQYNLLKHFHAFVQGARKFDSFTDFLKFKYFSKPNTPFAVTTTGSMRSKDNYYFAHGADVVFRVEEIQSEWAQFSQMYDLPSDLWDTTYNVQTPENHSYKQYYTELELRLVDEALRRDCKEYNYTY